MSVFMISRVRFQNGLSRYKTGKPFVQSGGHSVALIAMNLYHNVCFDNISVKFEYGLYGVNGSNFLETVCALWRPQFCFNLRQFLTKCLF